MSELDELAEDLGVDLKEEEKPESKEVAVTEIDTAEQIARGDVLIAKCKGIYQQGRENDLVWRWLIGEEVNDAYDHESIYESSILKRLSGDLDISVSDLSRFRKFYKSFDKEMLVERASVGYSWSHFKMINDISNGDVKERMISLMQQEDEAPKTKELQQTIADEKEAEANAAAEDRIDDGSVSRASDSDGSSSSSTSPIKPLNAALKLMDKLMDHLTTIKIQEDNGIDFETDCKEAKYNDAYDELGDRLKQTEEIRKAIWVGNAAPDPNDDDYSELENDD